jgi:hypothetical protein
MPKESKPLKGIIHYEIDHDKRNLKLKPYRKIVFRILNTHEEEFRKKLSIPDNQKFKVETKSCDMGKYDWDGCPEFEENENDIYKLHPNCQFIFYTENHFNSFVEKSGFKITKKAKTFWYPHEPDRKKLIDKGTY